MSASTFAPKGSLAWGQALKLMALTASITRRQLCHMAAKSLTAQPASDPFTACSDTSVLALVNAGVVSGMTETTFEPDGLLTRAQISKIIWYLNQV